MENWRGIDGYLGLYEVSDQGRVRRCETGNVLSGFDRGGYPSVGMKSKGRRQTRAIHLLVLESFVGPRPDGFHGAHLDGNPMNAALSNLIWATPSENEGHKRLHGTVRVGEQSHTSSFTNQQAEIIREIAASGVAQTKIAKLVGVRDETISEIVRRITYRV